MTLYSTRAANGVVVDRFHGLSAHCGLVHAISERAGGQSSGGLSSLNLSYAVGDDPGTVLSNRGELCGAIELDLGSVVCAAQVHGTAISRVGVAHRGSGTTTRATAIPGVDGLVTDEPGVHLWLSFADCLPLIAYDPKRRAIGAAHAGWRGTVGGIAARLVESMCSEYGSVPGDLLVGLGPCIGPCCYEIRSDVADAAIAALPSDANAIEPSGLDTWRFDLVRANEHWLRLAGVKPENIEVSGICTSCESVRFFSHRAQGGHAGRFAAIIGLEK